MGQKKLHYVAVGHVRALPLLFSAGPVSPFIKMLPSSDLPVYYLKEVRRRPPIGRNVYNRTPYRSTYG